MTQFNKDKLIIQITSIKNVFIILIFLFFFNKSISIILNLIYNTFNFTYNLLYYSICLILCVSMVFIWFYILCLLEDLFYCFIDTIKIVKNYFSLTLKNNFSNIKYDTDLGYRSPFKKNCDSIVYQINKINGREIIIID
ncbi:hypothetical protein RB653_006404 [Dictyostelium firmibasis]|uniref:Uncharacterized protein n=1 Tax=Dictyostelium firmibasis TaxID=79012 RepID=A0AAN7U996_9MYCE